MKQKGNKEVYLLKDQFSKHLLIQFSPALKKGNKRVTTRHIKTHAILSGSPENTHVCFQLEILYGYEDLCIRL